MNITTIIKTPRQRIIIYLADKGNASVRVISQAINIPKSTVHHHLNRLKDRCKYPESHLWETPEGDLWLRLFVLNTLYTFGLSCNIGADRLSRYFKQLRINTHVGVSPNSLRKLLRKIEGLLGACPRTRV